MAGVLDLGIDLDVWPWVWISVAVLFALVELTVLAGSFVLLPFAVSAFFAALAGFYDASVEVQWAIFFFLGAALWIAFWKYSKRFADNSSMAAGVGADRLVGVEAIVTVDIDPNDTERRGRVKVMGEEWGALTDGSLALRAGSRVRVASMNGTRVMVEPIVSTPPTDRPVAPPVAPPPAPPIDPSSEDS